MWALPVQAAGGFLGKYLAAAPGVCAGVSQFQPGCNDGRQTESEKTDTMERMENQNFYCVNLLLWYSSFCWLGQMLLCKCPHLTTERRYQAFLPLQPLFWWDLRRLCCFAPCLASYKCSCTAPWPRLLLAFPEPQRTWPGLVVPGTFLTNEVHIVPSPVLWPLLNGNFPIFDANLLGFRSATATLACMTHVPKSKESRDLSSCCCHNWTGQLIVSVATQHVKV